MDELLTRIQLQFYNWTKDTLLHHFLFLKSLICSSSSEEEEQFVHEERVHRCPVLFDLFLCDFSMSEE